MMLALCGRIGLLGADYMVCEFTGETVKNLSMDERMVLTNMTAEVGAKTGIIEPDKTFERRGLDLIINKEISLKDSLVGSLLYLETYIPSSLNNVLYTP